MVALAQYTEDLCFEDADLPGYGGYTQTLQTWPPSLQCVLQGGSDRASVTVDHWIVGVATSTWRFFYPPVAVVGLATFAAVQLKRRAVRTSAGT